MKQIVPSQEKRQIFGTTPFPERLIYEKQDVPKIMPKFDIIDELKNITINIPLLRAIKYTPIYTKTIRELCTK